MPDLSYDMLNQQNQGTAQSLPDPFSPRGDWGLGTRLIIKMIIVSHYYDQLHSSY